MSAFNNSPTNASRNAIWRRKWHPGVSNNILARERARRHNEVAGARIFTRLSKEERSQLVNDLQRNNHDELVIHISELGYDDDMNTLLYDYLMANRQIIVSNKAYQGGRKTRRRGRKTRRHY